METGARLFEPEPAKKGNSNTGENLKQVTRYPKAAAKILDCSEQLIYLLHEFLGLLESLESQNADELEEMGKQVFELFQHDFGEFSQLSHSFHLAVAHSGEVARYFQAQGFTIGELSECAQEAINAPTKKMLHNSVSEVPIKNKIWAVLSKIGLSWILSQWNLLNKVEY